MSEDKKKDEKRNLKELNDLLKQKDADKQQLQASYDEALQALADSEAKRETAERELKIAQDQMATMWKELESLHQRLDGSHPRPNPVSTSSVIVSVSPQSNVAQSYTTNTPSAKTTSNISSPHHLCPVTSPSVISTASPSQEANGPIELCCTLCNEKIRLNDLNDHSKVCSSKLKSTSPSPPTHSPKQQRKLQSRGSSPKIQPEKRSSSLIVNVTRTPTAATDLAPFKVVTWTNMTSQFSSESYEVYRSAGDFQWLHDVLQDNCPERAVPPLRTTISLDATVSEYQRFLSRLVAHKTLRTEQSFIVFLTGTIEELRVLRAKFRPHLPSEESLQYRPTQGRDTSSGALVATKDYLHSLENNLLGLLQGKWYAMKCLLDTPIKPSLRAIQFVSNNNTTTTTTTTGGGDNK
uniref:PX domain-containing protein n=1 Tax=Amphimedon queenslandica TaxID=400682 RepID=A0A1X7VC02_AMPQE